jgi:histidine triad (HIT) family protein
MKEETTIFEKIVAGEIPCTKIYEDENTFAFLDINPNSIGHTLVITKKPYRNIFDLPNDAAENLIKTVKKVAAAVKKATNCDGINIVMNNEKAAGQIVFHVHIHIIPRKDGDRGLHKHTTYKDGEMAEVANKIIASIE